MLALLRIAAKLVEGRVGSWAISAPWNAEGRGTGILVHLWCMQLRSPTQITYAHIEYYCERFVCTATQIPEILKCFRQDHAHTFQFTCPYLPHQILGNNFRNGWFRVLCSGGVGEVARRHFRKYRSPNSGKYPRYTLRAAVVACLDTLLKTCLADDMVKMSWFSDHFGFVESEHSFDEVRAHFDYDKSTGVLQCGDKTFHAGRFDCPSVCELREQLASSPSVDLGGNIVAREEYLMAPYSNTIVFFAGHFHFQYECVPNCRFSSCHATNTCHWA